MPPLLECPLVGGNPIVRGAKEQPHTQVVTKGSVRDVTGRRRRGPSHEDFVKQGRVEPGPERSARRRTRQRPHVGVMIEVAAAPP